MIFNHNKLGKNHAKSDLSVSEQDEHARLAIDGAVNRVTPTRNEGTKSAMCKQTNEHRALATI